MALLRLGPNHCRLLVVTFNFLYFKDHEKVNKLITCYLRHSLVFFIFIRNMPYSKHLQISLLSQPLLYYETLRMNCWSKYDSILITTSLRVSLQFSICKFLHSCNGAMHYQTFVFIVSRIIHSCARL